MIHKRQQGVFLITTLMMLVVLGLLVLTLLKGIFFYLKVTHEVMHRDEQFYQLEAQVMKLSLDNPACTVTYMHQNQMIDMLLNHEGCTLKVNHERYEYLIDDLGLFPCLTLGSKSSHHWLVTMVSAPPHQTFIQIRRATMGKALKCSLPDSRSIQEGVVSWRLVILD